MSLTLLFLLSPLEKQQILSPEIKELLLDSVDILLKKPPHAQLQAGCEWRSSALYWAE